MNRIIKFRAFSENTGMWSWNDIVNSPENDLRKLFVSPDWKAVMQFTGLLDKNGVEVFEGDVVKVTDPDFEPLIVTYQAPQFILQEIGNKENRISGGWNYTEKVEVIGNIYENPELLKESK